MIFGTRVNRYVWFALICGVVTGIYAYRYLRDASIQVPVVVAARDVPIGTRLSAEDIKVGLVSPSSIHPSSFRSLSEVQGKIVSIPLVSGEQILRQKLTGRLEGLAALLADEEAGMYLGLEGRGYPLGLIKPNQRVSVLAVMKRRGSENPDSRFILYGLRVLDTDGEQGGSGRGELQGITVAVRRGEAERLAAAMEGGRIHVLLDGAHPVVGQGVGDVTGYELNVTAPPDSEETDTVEFQEEIMDER